MKKILIIVCLFLLLMGCQNNIAASNQKKWEEMHNFNIEDAREIVIKDRQGLQVMITSMDSVSGLMNSLSAAVYNMGQFDIDRPDYTADIYFANGDVHTLMLWLANEGDILICEEGSGHYQLLDERTKFIELLKEENVRVD